MSHEPELCVTCGCSDADCVCPPQLTPGSRRRAHEAIDRWFDDLGPAAERAHEVGRSGYVGRCELRALFDDVEISLQIERSISEDP